MSFAIKGLIRSVNQYKAGSGPLLVMQVLYSDQLGMHLVDVKDFDFREREGSPYVVGEVLNARISVSVFRGKRKALGLNLNVIDFEVPDEQAVFDGLSLLGDIGHVRGVDPVQLQILYNGGNRVHLVDVEDYSSSVLRKGAVYLSGVSVRPVVDEMRDYGLRVVAGVEGGDDAGRRESAI